MAQTWRITPLKVGVFRLIDFLGRPFKGMLRSPRPIAEEIRNVLVMEPWHIGDVVLATPILRAIRARYATARITVLGKPHAEELLRHSGLVDEVIVFDIPWTAKTRKYNPARYDLRLLRELISKLRARRFDLTLDARMDLRSNILTYLSRAPRRIGFDFGGGAFLLTDAVPAQPDEKHRVEDWLELMRPLGAQAASDIPRESVEPMLRVSAEESEAAAAILRKAGIGPDDVVVAIHGGASDPRRMWPAESFERIAERLRVENGVKTVFFLEPAAADRDIPGASLVLRTSLREMMALLSRCNLFLCNDSGPMHIADALGVPVVAVFLTGNPVWHRPYRSDQIVVGAGTGHDFLVAPTEDEIVAAAKKQLAR